MQRTIKIVLVLGCLLATALAKQDSAVLKFTIVRDATGAPVRNAEIVLHFVGKDGKIKGEGIELKSHEDGKAQATGIVYGKLRIQVIAPGFRTYGEDFDINQPEHAITIKLQKPTGPLSIYK